MNAYLLALEIDPVEPGRIYIGLPLHCTVLHWFLADAPPEAVLERVRPVFAATQPILLTAGAPDRFGPSRGPRIIPVNRLEPSAQLTDLHRRLYHAVEPMGVQHTEPYVLDNFNFHVTKQGTRRFRRGTIHLATTAYLVEALDPIRIARKQIKARIELGKAK
jgi:2'-5' RNA ligase